MTHTTQVFVRSEIRALEQRKDKFMAQRIKPKEIESINARLKRLRLRLE